MSLLTREVELAVLLFKVANNTLQWFYFVNFQSDVGTVEDELELEKQRIDSESMLDVIRSLSRRAGAATEIHQTWSRTTKGTQKPPITRYPVVKKAA